MRHRNKPLEQPNTRALVISILNYLENAHGAFILVVVRDWIKDKDKRLEGLIRENKNDEQNK